MVVRIRIRMGRRTELHRTQPLPPAPPAVSGLLTLFAVVSLTLGGWRVFVDLGWLADLFLTDGIFSHWQLWLAAGVIFQLLAFRVIRLGAVAAKNA